MKDTILIVDDVADNLKLLFYDLDDAGYEVLMASSGKEALKIIASTLPDLILLDIMMPQMDGYEVCEKLKSDPRTDSIPIIMVSAKGSENDVIYGLELGACDYISKPYSWPIVKARIESALRSKHLQDRLLLAQEDARRASKAKSDFLSHMSHEIRTPIIAMMGYSELGLDPKEDRETINNYLKIIHESTGALLHIVNGLLDIAKIEEGKQDVNLVEFKPLDLINEVIDLLKNATKEKSLYLRAELGVLPHNLISDTGLIKQILINLLSNAIKFTHEGGVTLKCELEKSLLNPLAFNLVFRIEDSGIGMTTEQQKYIFERFVQAEKDTFKKYGGTGLGTTISKQVAQLMGGDISLQTEINKGSTFTVSIPVKLSQKELMRLQKPKTIEPLHGKVLLVDDNPVNLNLLSLMLSSLGLNNDSCNNAKDAIDLARSEQAYDLVLMDMHMPVMDGDEAIKILRETGYKQPIIGLTASVQLDDINRMMSSGCNEVAFKPLDKVTLYKLCAYFLKNTQSHN